MGDYDKASAKVDEVLAAVNERDRLTRQNQPTSKVFFFLVFFTLRRLEKIGGQSIPIPTRTRRYR